MLVSPDNRQLPEPLIGRDIVFFDGDCMLCYRLVQVVLRLDREGHFLLCSQQSDTGRALLARHSINVQDFSTVYVLKNFGTDEEQILALSSATLYVFSRLHSLVLFSFFLAFIPRPLLDFVYRCVAASRYRIFGKTGASCPPRAPDDRQRFIG